MDRNILKAKNHNSMNRENNRFLFPMKLSQILPRKIQLPHKIYRIVEVFIMRFFHVYFLLFNKG